jgi:hypothetical protein
MQVVLRARNTCLSPFILPLRSVRVKALFRFGLGTRLCVSRRLGEGLGFEMSSSDVQELQPPSMIPLRSRRPLGVRITYGARRLGSRSASCLRCYTVRYERLNDMQYVTLPACVVQPVYCTKYDLLSRRLPNGSPPTSRHRLAHPDLNASVRSRGKRAVCLCPPVLGISNGAYCAAAIR